MSAPTKWTKEEIELLERCYPNLSTQDIANKLKRPYHSVQWKINRLGLTKAPNPEKHQISATGGIITHPEPGITVHRSK